MNKKRWAQANNYWSSTTNANNTDNAWNVNFNNGNVNNDNKDFKTNYVRPVRGGQWRVFGRQKTGVRRQNGKYIFVRQYL